MVSIRSRKISLRSGMITTNTMSGEDFHFLDVGTSDAASALTYLRKINDVHKAPHHEDAMKYLKRVQMETTGKEYISFVGALKEFQEDVAREIDAKREYVIKCAVTLFQGHTDLILALGDFIPDIRDTLELDHPHEAAQKRRHQKADAMEWQQESLHNQTASNSENDPNVAPDRQTAASVHWQQEHVPSDAAIENFMINVQRRFQHANQAVHMKISRIVYAFLVDAAMPPRTAQVQMAALLRGHNDLWKEFERFLPPDSRAGSSSRANPSNAHENPRPAAPE